MGGVIVNEVDPVEEEPEALNNDGSDDDNSLSVDNEQTEDVALQEPSADDASALQEEELADAVIVDPDFDGEDLFGEPDGVREILEEDSIDHAEEETQFTVTYDPNGGYWFDEEGIKQYTPCEDIFYDDYDSYWFSDEFYKADAVLIGWSEEPEAEEVQYELYEEYSIESDLKLYAVWTPAVTVTLDAGEGASYSRDSKNPITGEEQYGKQKIVIQSEKYSEKYSVLYLDSYSDAFENDGLRISGWRDEEGTEYSRNEYVYVDQDLTLTAIWNTAYELTLNRNYDIDEENSCPEKVAYPFVEGENFNCYYSEKVWRDGYSLTGWSQDPEGTQLLVSLPDDEEEDEDWIELTEEMDGTTLYAVWTKRIFVQINWNGGNDEGDVETTDVIEGRQLSVWGDEITPPPGKALHSLIDEKTGKEYLCDRYVRVEDPYDGMVLTANWAAGVAVTYHADTIPGGAIYDYSKEEEVSTYTAYYESGKAFEPWADTYYSLDSENNHYSLRGWSLKNENDPNDVEEEFTVTKATDLYAVWEKCYLITYHPNNGDNDEEYEPEWCFANWELFREGSSLKGPEERSAFLGWSEDPDAESATYTRENPGKPTEDMTLYAVWSKEEGFLITYNTNGGYFDDGDEGEGSTKTVAVQSGQKFYETPNVSVDHEEKAFAGWSEDPDGETLFNEDTAVTADIALYAVWKEAAKITYDPNGGVIVWNGGSDKQVDPYTDKMVKGVESGWTPDVQREGYSFLGWSEKQNDTANVLTIDWDHPYTAAKDTTLFAVWKANTTAPANTAPVNTTPIKTVPAKVTTPTALAEQITIAKKPTGIKAKAEKKGKVTVSWKNFKASSKKKKAIWKKVKKIEVQYSTDSSFKTGVVSKTLGKKKTKLVVKKLQPKTTYFFRVRYIESTGKVSAWSAVKKVKVKK